MIELLLAVTIGLTVPIALVLGRRAVISASLRRGRSRPATQLSAPPAATKRDDRLWEAIQVYPIPKPKKDRAALARPAKPDRPPAALPVSRPAASRPATRESAASRAPATATPGRLFRRSSSKASPPPGAPVEQIGDHVHLRAGRYPGLPATGQAATPRTLDRVPPWLAAEEETDCPGCMTSRSKGAAFCIRCGRRLDSAPSQQRNASSRR